MTEFKAGWGDKFVWLKSGKTKHIIWIGAVLALIVWLAFGAGCQSGGSGGGGFFRPLPALDSRTSVYGGHVTTEVGLDQPAEHPDYRSGYRGGIVYGDTAYIEGIVRVHPLSDFDTDAPPVRRSPPVRVEPLASAGDSGPGDVVLLDTEPERKTQMFTASFDSFLGNIGWIGLAFVCGAVFGPTVIAIAKKWMHRRD